MHRKFIALIVTTATLVSVAAAPARANGEDFAKAIIGIAALAAIANAIDDHNDDKPKGHVVHRRAPHPHHVYRNGPKTVHKHYHYRNGPHKAHKHPHKRHAHPHAGHRPRAHQHHGRHSAHRHHNLQPRPLPHDVHRHAHIRHRGGYSEWSGYNERRNGEDR